MIAGRAGCVAGMVLAAAACNTPIPALRLQLATGDTQACPSASCQDVKLPCDVVMSVRIVDPEDTAEPFYSDCLPVPFDTNHTLCSLARIELDDRVLLPVRDLEVQIAIYPASAAVEDPTASSGWRCPTDVKYSASNGYPLEQSPGPALGGRAFYRPGDENVVVTLGCTDLPSIAQSCALPASFRVAATVDDFETLFPVPPDGVASQLRVAVGEPRQLDGVYTLTSASTHPLPQVVDEMDNRAVASWADDVDLSFERYVCVEVFEAVAETTGVLRCSEVGSAEQLGDLHGVRLAKDALTKVLGAMGESPSAPLAFPQGGLTIGIVADQFSKPIEGMKVNSVNSLAGPTTIRYLSREGTFVDEVTSRTGIFVSTDAPFGTMFYTSGGPGGRQEIAGVGGLVADRVTVVVLQYSGQ